jgi:hypothetical protein
VRKTKENESTFNGKPCRKCGAMERYVDYKRCVNCHRRRARRYPPASVEKRKSYNLKTTYGISLESAKWIANEQNWQCPICEVTLNPDDAKKLFNVDHHHGTGQIRGILCNKCNAGLGYFRDNPRLLRRAAAYLEESGWDDSDE